MKLKSVIHKFSTARAEFHSTTDSVHGRFVVPPFMDTIDLAAIDHSMAIVGGRGCGKTTYVKYFSHWTQFDKEREDIEKDALDCIILYWKPDTAYCRSLSKNWLTEQNARRFFHALSGISLLDELFSSIENISRRFPILLDQLSGNVEFWNRVKKITGQDERSVTSIKNWAEDQLYDVQVSINANDISGLIKIDPKAMLELLLPALTNGCDLLGNTRFKVFVDEFENLAEYQQKIINSYRKHSTAFISWNVAHKRFAKLSNATDGDEKLQHGNDYREYILDESFENEQEEKFFLCELLLLGLLAADLKCEISSLSPKILGDRSQVAIRKDKAYRKSVSELVKRILPSESNRELAKIAMGMSSVRTATKQALAKIESLSEQMIEKIILENPEVAIATIAISSQKSFKDQELISYVDSNFSTDHKYSQRVQTYLFTALLNLNARYSYIDIPIYSGFDRFCQLSILNIRHFFDLCYSSFRLMNADQEIDNLESFPNLSLEHMHKGAISSSTNIIEEISTYTPMGLTLKGLVNRLGDIFQIWQKGDNQSEPERTHFFILHDFGSLPSGIQEVIDQAKCWRVLIEYPATKDKNSNSSSGYEYRLNPIYAPYFSISFRKIRRIEFTEKTIFDICFGDNVTYEAIRSEHIQWSKSISVIDSDIEQRLLF